RRRTLRLWWNREGPTLEEHALNAAQTEALNALLDTDKGKINLPGDTYAIRTGKHLILRKAEKEEPAKPVPVNGKETVFGEYRLTVSQSEGNPGDGKRVQEVPEGFLEGCEIRTRRPGDRIRPFGSKGSRKLQDYLTDRRIGEPFRDSIPLVCRENEVLLVCGVGAGNIPRWNKEDSPVRVTWSGEMPWTE
ncbi:MAG: tRNA lysidine(34) synthetase TilS, partial [Clostridia bacterium]|nr:tRNA lysidine(34) synthetase TilS [Clostridia bacterium]